MNYNDLYDKITKEKSISDIDFLKLDISGYDDLHRCDIADELIKFSDNVDVQRFVLKLFDDKSYLVRSSAYDFCSFTGDKSILAKCINYIEKECNAIARTYLIASINDIIKRVPLEEEQYNYLYALSKKEKNANVYIQYNNIFFTVTNDVKYLYEILKQINNDDYHIRCVVINSIPDILTDIQKEIVIEHLEKRLKKERSFAVKDSIIKKLDLLTE